MLHKWFNKVENFFFTPVHPSALNVFRIGLAGVIAFYYTHFVLFSSKLIHFTNPTFQIPMPLTPMIVPLPGEWMILPFAVMVISAYLVCVGWKYRLFMPLLFLSHSYIFLAYRHLYQNHNYFLMLLFGLMCFMSPHEWWSLDAKKNGVKSTRFVPRWQPFIIQFLMVWLIFVSAIQKMASGWLFGHYGTFYMSQFNTHAFFNAIFNSAFGVALITHGAILLELILIWFVFTKRWKWVALLPLLFFHSFNSFVLFTPITGILGIGIFGYVGIVSLVIFLEPDTVEKLKCRMGQRLEQFSKALPTRPSHRSFRWYTGICLSLCVCVLAIQFIYPLKRWAYPSNVRWIPETKYFSWAHSTYNHIRGKGILYLTQQNGKRSSIMLSTVIPDSQKQLLTNPWAISAYARHTHQRIQDRLGHPIDIRMTYAGKMAFNNEKKVLALRANRDVNQGTHRFELQPWIRDINQRKSYAPTR